MADDFCKEIVKMLFMGYLLIEKTLSTRVLVIVSKPGMKDI